MDSGLAFALLRRPGMTELVPLGIGPTDRFRGIDVLDIGASATPACSTA